MLLQFYKLVTSILYDIPDMRGCFKGIIVASMNRKNGCCLFNIANTFLSVGLPLVDKHTTWRSLRLQSIDLIIRNLLCKAL